jgi:hypothetical protein
VATTLLNYHKRFLESLQYDEDDGWVICGHQVYDVDVLKVSDRIDETEESLGVCTRVWQIIFK